MAVDITPSGNGSWVGAPANTAGFSFTEEITPLAGGDSSGAIGGGSFSVNANAKTRLLMHDEVAIKDAHYGATRARIAGVNITGGHAADVTIDSRMILLLAERSIPPYNGTLGGWFTAAFSLCGITTNFTVAPTIASRPVTYAAYVGEVWEAIKGVCAAQQIEVALQQETIEVRLPRLRVGTLDYLMPGESLDIGESQMARAVEVRSYENVWNSSGLVYPTGGWNESVQVFQVGATEVIEFDVAVEVSVVSIVQPTPVVWVGRNHSSPSVYAVAGNDGLPIQPAQWIAEGGKLEVTINEDYESLHVKLTGSGNERLAPYSIAMSAGTSDMYSSLRIVGSGVWKRETLDTFLTGVDPSLTADEVGETIDAPFAFGRAQVFGIGVSAAQRFTGQRQTLSGSMTNLFHASSADSKQSFGAIAGTRLRYADNDWRVRSGTITEGDQSFNAEPDTTFADFDTVHAGKTFGGFDTAFAGFRFSEFDIMPLRTG